MNLFSITTIALDWRFEILSALRQWLAGEIPRPRDPNPSKVCFLAGMTITRQMLRRV